MKPPASEQRQIASRIPLADIRRTAKPLGPQHPLNVVLASIREDSLPAPEFLSRAKDWIALLGEA